MSENPIGPVLLSQDDAAVALSMSLTSFKVHVKPEIKVIRRGSRVLVPLKELEAWVERNAAPAL